MKTRCLNPNDHGYPNYGGRGVTICDRWINSFESFLADMGPKPTPKHTLDRYPDPHGNYEPGNCRWATRKEQNNNRRNSHFFEYGGERLTVQQFADRFNRSWRFTYRTLFEDGLSPDRAIEALRDAPRRGGWSARHSRAGRS